MKLTQRTLFQCFEKSRPKPPSLVNDSPCESQIKSLPPSQREPDYLLPVHIRQLNHESSHSNRILSLNERTINDDNPQLSTQEFYRICPTIVNTPNSLPNLEFTPISSTERQQELFQQYTDAHPEIDWMSMFEQLQQSRSKAIEQNQYEQLLWTDIYRPKTSKTYLGNHTRQVQRLNAWFSYWANKLQNEQPKIIVQKKRKRLADDDHFDEDYADDSNMSYHQGRPEHPRLIFIHGSGTTSLVHALAEEYSFKVTEINGSQSRARAPLLKQLEQVTNHHHLSFKRCPSDTPLSQEDKSKMTKEISSPLPAKKKAKNDRTSITSYFHQPPKSDHDESEQKENSARRRAKPTQADPIESTILTNQINLPKEQSKHERPTVPTDNAFISSVHVEKTSLILFDEIETLTSDDNFWSCLKKLLEAAKKPIILTSNSRTNPEDAIMSLSKLGYYELIHLEPNDPEFVCCFLRLILLIEMFETPSFDSLLALFQSCSSDLRLTLLTLQFLAQSSVVSRASPSFSEKRDSIIAKPQWQPSQIFDAMYYSHLGERWRKSELQELFDHLTQKYTSEYNQSHRLLIEHSQKNEKRHELFDTFKFFMQEQEIANITDHPSFYLDYRPYVRQICQSEQMRTTESSSNRRLRHSLSFRGCSLQWSDFEILSAGID